MHIIKDVVCVCVIGVLQERAGTTSCWHVWGTDRVRKAPAPVGESVAVISLTSTLSLSSSSVHFWLVSRSQFKTYTHYLKVTVVEDNRSCYSENALALFALPNWHVASVSL